MSVGHIQRAVETAGIATTSVYVKSFGHIPGLMSLPRTLITQHPMGRPLGAPGDRARQLDVVNAALDLLRFDAPTITEFAEKYRIAP